MPVEPVAMPMPTAKTMSRTDLLLEKRSTSNGASGLFGKGG